MLFQDFRHISTVQAGSHDDLSVRCTFGYIPLTRPPPFYALKAVAYQEKTPLLDPTIDVDGWVLAKAVNLAGTLSKLHPVVIECQLFLSAPLAYTRGSVIPLYIRMQSSNQQALDLLARHNALVVRLQRRIEYSLPMKSMKNADNYHAGKNKRDLAEAVWWPTATQEQEASPSLTADTQTHTVCLNGELHLRGDLVPSTMFPVFTVGYDVCLWALDARGLKMAETEKSLLEHPVEIVTLFAPGPRAVRYAPPGSGSERPLPMEFGMALGTLGSAYM
ncbi:hypothetical protein D9619_004150 [Psilocybe cf. subviscida]|uniref:Arrestin-like N-terminal domain-containing protein n=1 Tax=Psilocybe cf. subviscida TaxID=2480587 RepID=A0A8H5BQV9_9AGAR|nr:hypothetical protein D9619_004150 [Psilocybe cf. subviscida]